MAILKKRVFPIVMALVMIVTMLPIQHAHAANEDEGAVLICTLPLHEHTRGCHCNHECWGIIPEIIGCTHIHTPLCYVHNPVCGFVEHVKHDESCYHTHNYSTEAGREAPTCTEPGSIVWQCACGETRTETIPAGHTPVTDAAVAPTCTKPGLTEGTHCSVCGETLTAQESVPTAGHDYDEGTVVQEPTCAHGGSVKHTCLTCGSVVYELLEKTESHTAGAAVTENVFEASCTAAGSYDTVVYCSVCSVELSRTTTTVPATGHDYDEGTVEQEPTCAHGGSVKYVCRSCGSVVHELLEKTDSHTAGDAVTENFVDSTCTKTGSYDTVVYCSVCSVELSRKANTVAIKDHNYDGGVVTTEATCTAEGVLTFTCGDCGDTYTKAISAVGHTEGETDVENNDAPTCTEDGSYDNVVYCTVCDAELSRKTITVDALGHTEVIDAAVEATCTESGLTEGTHCSVCGEVLVAQTVVDALGHTEVIDEAVEATCTESGLTEGKHCSVCGEVLVAQTVVDALGHTEVIDEAVEATCTESGLTEGKHCSICGEVLVAQTFVDALGHTTETVVENNVGATCTAEGSFDTVAYCTVCGEELSRETTTNAALGHTAGETVVENNVAPNCEDAGSYDNVVYCTVCGEELSRETVTVDALGHTAGETVVENNVAPTCTENGSYDNVVYCSVCGEELSRETTAVDALGHSYGAWYTVTAASFYLSGLDRRDCQNCDHFETNSTDRLGGDFIFDGDDYTYGEDETDDTVVIEDEETPLAAGELLNVDEYFAYLNGYGDEVKPENNITRAEFVTIIFRLLNDDIRLESWGTESRFADVTEDDWFFVEVTTCDNLGILDYYEGEFEPNAPITRAEVAYIIAMFTGDAYEEEENLFDDIADSFAADAINDIAVLGIVSGDGTGNFRPNASITRAEISKMINILLGRDTEALTGDMMNWGDNAEGKWYYDHIRVASNSFDPETLEVTEEKKDWAALKKEWAEDFAAMESEDESEDFE